MPPGGRVILRRRTIRVGCCAIANRLPWPEIPKVPTKSKQPEETGCAGAFTPFAMIVLLSLPAEFAQRIEQPFHLFQRVVMHQADAQHPALLFHLQALRQIDRVIVPVPREDSALG